MQKNILAIDPGYDRCGVAVLDVSSGVGKESLVFSDCIETDKKLAFEDRLYEVVSCIEELIQAHKPDVFAIETLFFNTNQKTATKVSEVRGALLYLAKKYNLQIEEFTPLQIKVATTNSGRATKKEVYEMVKRLVKIEKSIKLDDEFDAIACALTCSASIRI